MFVSSVAVGGVSVAPPVTSYSNTGGTGARTGVITVTRTAANLDTNSTPSKLVDGSFTAGTTGACNVANGASISANQYVRFDFLSGVKKYIDEFKLYCDRAISNMGSWTFQASNDASTWTDLATFTWNAQTKTVTCSGLDLAGYRYYQIICPAGTTSQSSWFEEVEFKIAAGV